MTRVLVVEEESSSEELPVRNIAEAGHEARKASDDGNVYDVLGCHGAGIILADGMMPPIGGFHVLSRLGEGPGAQEPLFFLPVTLGPLCVPSDDHPRTVRPTSGADLMSGLQGSHEIAFPSASAGRSGRNISWRME